MPETDLAGPKITLEEFQELAWEGVPYVGQLGPEVLRFEAGEIAVLLPYREILLRPGGTICGPAMMALADIALYGLVLSMIGRAPLAVTTDMTVHFLTRPKPGAVVAEARLLKLGRRLAVGDVLIHSEHDDRPVCHVTGTYAIPPDFG